jgi:hypothetical protein
MKQHLQEGETMDAGPQPLDELMTRRGIANHELVEKSDQHLTHKEVQKGRRGRRLTLRTQQRIRTALQARLPDETLSLDDLFTYRGR